MGVAAPQQTPTQDPSIGAKPSPGGRPDHATAVREMFEGLSPRYDLLNRVLSGGVDLYWRRKTAQLVARQAPAGAVLDSCAGTLDLTRSLRKHRGAGVIGADFAPAMLQRGRAKLRRWNPPPPLLAADALRLPHPDGALAAVTVAFGIRNVADVGRGLREMARVLMPGGVAAILEFSMPTTPVLGPLYRWYLTRVVPFIGRLLTGKRVDAYGYLAASIKAFPDPEAFAALCRASGFAAVERRRLTFGICSLWICRKRGQTPFSPGETSEKGV